MYCVLKVLAFILHAPHRAQLHRLRPRLWVLLHVLRKFLVAMNQAAASTLILAKIQLVKLVLEEARIEYVLRKRCLDVLKMVVTPVAAPIVA